MLVGEKERCCCCCWLSIHRHGCSSACVHTAGRSDEIPSAFFFLRARAREALTERNEFSCRAAAAVCIPLCGGGGRTKKREERRGKLPTTMENWQRSNTPDASRYRSWCPAAALYATAPVCVVYLAEAGRLGLGTVPL